MSLPETMRVIRIAAPGGPEQLQPDRAPVPQPAAGEVLIRVLAAGVNRPDVEQRKGVYPPPPGASPLPGLEVAGEIAALGAEVAGLSLGDRVTALTPGGGYAEFCIAPSAHCLPWPQGYDAIRAAALPETFFTVWANVFDRGRLQAGESLLVHGGSSGIGTTAVQLGRAFGARVLATVGSADKAEAVQALGAEATILYRQEDFVARVKDLTDGAGVDVILDMIGAEYLERNLQALALDGRLCLIGFLGGAQVEGLDLRRILMRRLTITGSTLRPRTVAQKAAIAKSLREKVWPLLESGKVAPVIDRVMPLDQAAAAHQRMESSQHIGKIILTLSPVEA